MSTDSILRALRAHGPMTISDLVEMGFAPRRAAASRTLNTLVKYDLVRRAGRTSPSNGTHAETIWEAVR